MRAIERTSQFKRDYKREAKGPYRMTLERDLFKIIKALAHKASRFRKGTATIRQQTSGRIIRIATSSPI